MLNKNSRSSVIHLSAVILVLVTAACLCSPAGIFGLEEPPVSSTAETPLNSGGSTQVAPEATAIISPEQPAVSGLQDEPPWLIISTSEGIMAANPDGSSITPLTGGSYVPLYLRRAISSAARKIARIESQDYSYSNPVLQVLSIPDGREVKRIPLSTPETRPSDKSMPGEPAMEAMRAIVEQPSYAWCPDGSKLAFSAALDRENAEIYVYDLQEDSITRVADGPGQNYWPSWSPDCSSILSFDVESFGTGAGYDTNGIWLSAADGSGSEMLMASESSAEQMVGWRDDHTAILTSWDPANGTNHLRLLDTRTAKQTDIIRGALIGAAATGADDGGTILYALEDGLYLLPGDSALPRKISGEVAARYGYDSTIQWLAEDFMFTVLLEDNRLITLSADAGMRQDAPYNPSQGVLETSAYGLIWAWTDDGGENEGAWVSGPGLQTVQVYSGPAAHPLWTVDNDMLFFVGQDLYASQFNTGYDGSFKVAVIPTGDVLDAAWLGFDDAVSNKYGP